MADMETKSSNVLIYLIRHDLRVSDNPILHKLASTPDHGFTHLIPLLSMIPQHLEISGFLKAGATSPYPEARSQIGGFWRCGPHRAKFIGESILNMKSNLSNHGSELTIKVGKPSDVLERLVEVLHKGQWKAGAVWMIKEEGVEEESDEKSVSEVCSKLGIDLQVWTDEKYFVDE